MTIHGYFKDYKNNTIDVLIYKPGDITNYIIDEYLDENCHFCFNGDEPVVITHDCSDLFEPVISSKCTIKLVSNIWCGDILFSNGIGDIIVRVTRTVNNTTELMFVGYVTPLTFSQDINQRNNIIDIVCYDVLGCLEDKSLSTGSTYETTLANASFSSFKQILNRIGLYNNVSPSTYVFPNEQYNTQLYVDTSIVEFLDLTLSDNLWLGDGKDNEMTLYEILIEILKYTNSRIVSVDGQTLYMIDNSTDTNRNRMFFLNTNDYVDFPLMLDVLPTQDMSDAQVTIDDCYNVIGVKCDLESVDDVIVSPLKKENYRPQYIAKQVCMTEYACEYEDATYNSIWMRNWKDMIIQNTPVYYSAIVDYTGIWMRHWYINFCKANNWEIYNEFIPPKSNGNLIRQYESIGRMNDLFNLAVPTRIQSSTNPGLYTDVLKITASTPLNLYPAFIEIGHSEKQMTAINPEEGKVTMEPHLIIPCPETWRYYKEDNTPVTEEWAYNYINAQFAKYEEHPMITYKSSTVANFTPSDETITNWLIFSGKITLIPSCEYEIQNVPNMGYQYRGMSMPNSFQEFIWGEQGSPGGGRYYTPTRQDVISNDKDKRRWYYRTFWTKENPNQEIQYVVHDPDEHSLSPEIIEEYHCEQESGSPTYRRGILYSLSTDGMYSKQFGWGNTQIDKRNTTVINIGYVPLLQCKLRIGDKWLNEIQVEGQELPKWEWTTDSNSVFSLGVKPSRPDNLSDPPTHFLIGEEYPLINTVTDAMNLQGNPEGTAIPITFDDKIKGDIEFHIVGPYNAVLTSVNHYYRHATVFRNEKSWSEQNAEVCVLNHVHAIDITDFEMKPYSNNAKNTTWNEGDLLYYSEDNKKYNNPKDDIEFKIVTALTAEEAAELNVAAGISYNNPTDTNGDLYLPETKPEEIYIQTMYDLYSTPKKIVEYEATMDSNKISEMYRTVYENDLMEGLDIEDFKSIIIGDELDLKQNRMKIKTKEI